MGDFNCNLVNTDNNTVRNFVKTFESLNLHILKLNPTHYSSNSESWIDHVIVSEPDKAIVYGQIPVPGISRHDLLYLSYSMNCPKYKQKLFRTVTTNISMQLIFLSDSIRTPWQLVYQQTSIDDKVNVLNNIGRDLFAKHAPLKHSSLRVRQHHG